MSRLHGRGEEDPGGTLPLPGLEDVGFRMVPLLESGRDAGWPF